MSSFLTQFFIRTLIPARKDAIIVPVRHPTASDISKRKKQEKNMNEKELREIKRRFRPDRSNIPNIVGCFINSSGQIISRFNQSILLSEGDESEELLSVMKKTLSGSLGTNLTDIEFSTRDVLEGEEHKLLTALRDSHLKDEAALSSFFAKVAESVHMESNYVVLLANDIYDVYTKESDEESGSSTTFSYVVCSICPLKDSDAGLFFREADKLFHSVTANAILTRPVLGFMFPTFDDRMTNIYHALYYTKDISSSNPEFVSRIFGKEAPMPPKVQRSAFSHCVSSALGEECSFEVVKSVNMQIAEMVEEHKEMKIPEPLTLTKSTVRTLLSNCGVEEAKLDKVGEKLDESYGKNAELCPKNVVTTTRLDIQLPDVKISVKKDKISLVSTQVIGGKKYIMIEATEGVEVNGIPITISE